MAEQAAQPARVGGAGSLSRRLATYFYGRPKLALALLLAPPLLWLGAGFGAWVLLPLVTLPLALRLVRTLASAVDGPTLNKTLAGTAQLGLIYSLLFAVGIML